MTKSNSILKFIESIYEKPDKRKNLKINLKNKPKKLKTKDLEKLISNKRHLNFLQLDIVITCRS